MKSDCVQLLDCSNLVGYELDETINEFRFRPANGESRLAPVRFPTRSAIYPVPLKSRIGFFFALNRVATGNRVRRPTGEGMARGEHSPTRLIGRSSSSFCQRAGCNSAPREKGSVGDGDHCARLFQMRSETTDGLFLCKPFPKPWGWFSSLTPSNL